MTIVNKGDTYLRCSVCKDIVAHLKRTFIGFEWIIYLGPSGECFQCRSKQFESFIP